MSAPRPPHRAPPPTSRAPRARPSSRDAIVLRTVALAALVGGTIALASSSSGSLSQCLAARGVTLDASSVRWLEAPGLRARRVLFLGREKGDLRDLYVATVRTGANDSVIALDDLSNLTRSPDADEDRLVTSGRWAAFTTRAGGAVAAVTLVDTTGDPAARENTGDTSARLRAAVTRWQQTGRRDGYGTWRYDLVPTARQVTLALGPENLSVRAEARVIRIELPSLRVAQGERFVRARPRLSGTIGGITWLVDTVRAIPWVGSAPIAWAEHVAFGLKNDIARARIQVQGDHSQTEVAEDLADVLAAGATGHTEGRVIDWPPPPLTPMISPRLAREGEWSAAAEDDPFVGRNPGAPPPFYQTFIRTDRERPDTRVYVTIWDARQVELHTVPGAQEPMGATGETGSGSVPRDPRTLTRLVGGFNGGFQALHGEWGVYAEGTLFLPPKAWGATIFTLADGATGFGSWPNDPSIPREVTEFRQNLTPLVEDGAYNPYRRTFWGGNVPGSAPGDEHTSRTGVCLTREGFVAFFWGEDLLPRSLADGMLATRCAYGVHLDMNGANTGFEFFRVTPTRSTPPLTRPLATSHEAEGTVSSAPGFTYRARKMVRAMHEMSFPRYIRRDPRDFFYLMLRPVLPGPALTAPITPAQPGEGQWHVTGLGDVPFPWPMARTRVRPDPARPDRWVNLVRIDPRRVQIAPAETTAHVLARVVGVSPATGDTHRLAWDGADNLARWAIGTVGTGIEGTPLTPGASVTRGVGIDADGYLVFAVADRAQPDLVARALDVAGCGPARLGLTPSAAITVAGDRDVAGAAIDPGAVTVFTLVERPMRGGVRVFPEVTPVPPSVWYDAQHRRVRYHRSEDGNVEVNTVGGGHVIVPSWGGNTPRNTPGTTPGTAPPSAGATPPAGQ